MHLNKLFPFLVFKLTKKIFNFIEAAILCASFIPEILKLYIQLLI